MSGSDESSEPPAETEQLEALLAQADSLERERDPFERYHAESRQARAIKAVPWAAGIVVVALIMTGAALGAPRGIASLPPCAPTSSATPTPSSSPTSAAPTPVATPTSGPTPTTTAAASATTIEPTCEPVVPAPTFSPTADVTATPLPTATPTSSTPSTPTPTATP